MKVLVTGGRGQLGRALVRRGPAAGHEIIALDSDELDICDQTAIERVLHRVGPGLVINAAASMRADSDRERAFAINAEGAGNVARAAMVANVPLLHISTVDVFDGTGIRPYREDDPAAPCSVYGESKAAGERAVFAAGGSVVRTSWLFGEGGPSFVHDILHQAKTQTVVRVASDQRGCPTWADDLADALYAIERRASGAAMREAGARVGTLQSVRDAQALMSSLSSFRDAQALVTSVTAGAAESRTFHYCSDWMTSLHAFAVAIVDEARKHTTLACETVEAIASADDPTPGPKPRYSVLDVTRARELGIVPPSWRTGLAAVVARDAAGAL